MKQYSIGLITGALLTASALMFMGAQNKYLGDIAVSSIKLIDDDGTVCGYIDVDDGSEPYIQFYNKDLQSIYISSDILALSDSGGDPFVAMGIEDSTGGVFKVYNNSGDVAMKLFTTNYGAGSMKIKNSEGNNIIGLGSSITKDGLIVLYNKNGEFGWGVSGEKGIAQ